MGPLGIQETVFIFVLALLIFGPRKLPELGKTIGKAMSEFRRASSELRATFDREMNAIERENESLKEVAKEYQPEQLSTYHDSYYDSGEYHGSYDNHSADHTSVSASATQGADHQVDQQSPEHASVSNGSSPQPVSPWVYKPAGAPDSQSVKS